MRKILRFRGADIRPEREAVLKRQGVPKSAASKYEALLSEALDLLTEVSVPVAVVREISSEEFAQVFQGEQRNDSPNPLEAVFPRASTLALFGATLGPAVCAKIAALFDAGDYASWYMLDAAASLGAEALAKLLQAGFRSRCAAEGRLAAGEAALCYSPGYCGWHISGQTRLFSALGLVEIGMTLRPSFLMEPLKSVSGVIVCGESGVHVFDDVFEFCAECRHHTCRERIAGVGREHGNA